MTHFPLVDATNLKVCGARLLQEQNAAWNATNQNDTGPPPQLELPYSQCLAECGGGLGDVYWQGLSGTLGSWLLPWISLMFQIPFGGERKFLYFTSIHCIKQSVMPHRAVG